MEEEAKFRQIESFFFTFEIADSLKLFEDSPCRICIEFGEQQEAFCRLNSMEHCLFEEMLADNLYRS